MRAKPQGSGDESPPAGSRGARSPGRGSGGRSPQKLKNFKSIYKQILPIFG